MEEWNDVYDIDRRKTGRVHKRGTPWQAGDYGLVVCVWVCDGAGKLLLTRRAPEKSFSGTWENSGGAVKAGEESLPAIRRELYEETGILAEEEEFQLIDTGMDSCTHYDFYYIEKQAELSEIRLLPGETDGVMWADHSQVHEMIQQGKICKIIGDQFLRQESMLLLRNMAKD